MQVLDRTGVGTLWSICKTKFALAGHTHNYAGSGSAGGSANSAISVVDYGQTSKTIQIGYAGSGITGEQIKYIAGYTTGSGDVNAKIKDVSKDALRSWLGLGTLAYSSATITDNKVTQNAVKSSDYTNWRSLVFSAANSATEGFTPSTTTDGVFIANTLSVQPSSGTIKANKFKGALEGNASTASNASTVNGHTVNANVPSNAKFTDTNTWRPIQDNLTSTSTSESLSANQGRILKGLVDGKANSSHTHSWSQISGAPATATRWPSWGEVTGKPDLKNWSETKSYIDNKAASSGGVDSLPVGTLLRTYNNKNIFGDNWKLADGSNVVADQLSDLKDTVESNGNIIKETKQNVVEFNKYRLYYTRAACNFGGKFYVVNRSDTNAYTDANLFIIDENSCTSHYIFSTPYEGQYSIQVNNEDIFIFVKMSDSLIVYYSKNGSNIKFTEIDLFAYDAGIDTSDNTLNSFSMIGGGKAIAVYSPKSQYDSQIVFQIYDGKYQRISDKFKKNISQLGWLNGACYCTIDKSIYKISSDYNISQVFTGSNNITSLQLYFYSNYCIIVNYSTPIYYTKDFNTYTSYSGSYTYMDFNIYRSFVYMNGSNNENDGFRNSSFIQKVNDQYLYIFLDDSKDYIAIGLLVKNDNMYFLTMCQNFNTFRIYKMHIPIGSKVLPNISDTYIKVK